MPLECDQSFNSLISASSGSYNGNGATDAPFQQLKLCEIYATAGKKNIMLPQDHIMMWCILEQLKSLNITVSIKLQIKFNLNIFLFYEIIIQGFWKIAIVILYKGMLQLIIKEMLV